MREGEAKSSTQHTSVTIKPLYLKDYIKPIGACFCLITSEPERTGKPECFWANGCAIIYMSWWNRNVQTNHFYVRAWRKDLLKPSLHYLWSSSWLCAFIGARKLLSERVLSARSWRRASTWAHQSLCRPSRSDSLWQERPLTDPAPTPPTKYNGDWSTAIRETLWFSATTWVTWCFLEYDMPWVNPLIKTMVKKEKGNQKWKATLIQTFCQ